MRTARKLSAADIYHVVSRGVAKQLIFEDDRDREWFLDDLSKTVKEDGGELLAWCYADLDSRVRVLCKVDLVSS